MIPRISIHALREEGDRPAINPRSTSGDFYPRPPRGGRHGAHLRPSCPSNFYPRPPRGGRPVTWTFLKSCKYFYPRPPRGGRLRGPGFLLSAEYYFYPRPPRGGRHRPLHEASYVGIFLSTPSARRATAKTETKSLFSNKLYNILHEFRRALIYNGSKNYPNHAK